MSEGNTRTPGFWEMLRKRGTMSKSEIEKMQDRLSNPLFQDNRTHYFIHETNNSLGAILNGEQVGTNSQTDYDRARERLLAVRNGLDWFTENGEIPREKIERFLDEAERSKWDLSGIKRLKGKLKKMERESTKRTTA